MLHPPVLLHPCRSARPERTPRAAEPVRAAERDGVRAGRDLVRRAVECRRSVEQPGTVEVDSETELTRGRYDFVELVERPDTAACVVVRVLERDDRRSLVRRLRPLGGRYAHLHARAAADGTAPAANHAPPGH